MPKRLIDLDDDLLAAAQRELNTTGVSDTVRTALQQVAKAAAAAGVGWVVLNHEADYILELRRMYKVPVFAVSADHVEIGSLLSVLSKRRK